MARRCAGLLALLPVPLVFVGTSGAGTTVQGVTTQWDEIAALGANGRAPSFLHNVNDEARVNSFFLDRFEYLLAPHDGRHSLAQLVEQLTGKGFYRVCKGFHDSTG